jgi:hypothetical protein
MNTVQVAAVVAVAAGSVSAQSFTYAAEDGGNTDSSLSQFDANATWGNYFTVEPGFGRISAIEVAFATGFAGAGRAVELLVYDDPDDDGDPTNAILVSQTSAGAILTPDGEPARYAVDAVDVTGGFFVAINMDAFQGEQVFRQDFFEPGDSSWTFYNPAGAVQTDLGSSLFIGNNQGFGLGTWVVRAVGVPSPAASVALVGAGVFGARRRR